ncbi:MAG: hypothetical protein ABID61_04570 [Candidatus Micrarchaeota archaeon]
MRAFIFSLDAFVAFTLALVVIYSLIFFSSVPSAYYHLLTQGHYLTRDILYSLSTTQCSGYFGCITDDTAILDNIAFSSDGHLPTIELIKETAGEMVPNQFGYVLEVSKDQGQTWITKYNTSAVPADPHADSPKKLQISTVVMAFNYPSAINKMDYPPYNYMTCGFSSGWSAGDSVPGSGGSVWTDWGIITCGELTTPGGSPGTGGYIIGNHPPEETLQGELVPSTDVRLVRFTIYI